MTEKDLYLPSGYLDMEKIINIDVPFIFVIGSRGIGKTYGAIQALIKRKELFLLMRSTQIQADLIANDDFTPLKEPLADMGMEYKVIPFIKQSKKIIDPNSGVTYCYTGALSTFGNMRGFASADTKAILYDEFVPQPGERGVKDAGEVLFHAYETINRNRELKGHSPVKLICNANSFMLANDIFMTLGVVTLATRMVANRRSVHIDKKRGLAIIIPYQSPISSEKAATALYSLTRYGSGNFNDLALGNAFVNDIEENIKPQPIREYRLLCTVGEISVYKHKSENRYYVASHAAGAAKDNYEINRFDLERFKKKYGWLWFEFLAHTIWFEHYPAQVLLEKYLKTA